MAASNFLSAGYGNPLLRDWHVANTRLNARDLIYPIFVLDEDGKKNAIDSMPGQFQWSVDRLHELLDPLVTLGLKSVLLFGVVTNDAKKSTLADYALDQESPVVRATKKIRQDWPDLYVICDVCICQYTWHGHCGILKQDGTIDNQASIDLLGAIALVYAKAGAHMVAPSDMMDCRIAAIKAALKKEGLERQVPVMAYSAKFASAMYGPFRDIAHSMPQFGDRKDYQLPTGSSCLALRALKRDESEGADFLMVKPGGSYLDIIKIAKQETLLPISVYQVSGEYAEMMAGAEAGVYDLQARVNESMVAFKRAGADIIITYFVPYMLAWMKD